MNRDQILEVFKHRPLSPESVETQRAIAKAMTEAVLGIVHRLSDCAERSAFIDLCLQAQTMANAAAARTGIAPADRSKRGRDRPGGATRSLTGAPESRDVAGVRLGLPGAFHRATGDRPSFETHLDVPPGIYGRALFRFTLHHGGWSPSPARNQNLFWFARDKHRDLFGFGVAKGPGGPPQVFYRTDWGVRHTDKQRVVRHCLLPAGATYDVLFDFDAAGRSIVLTLTDSQGAQVLRSAGKPNITSIPFDEGQRIAVGFGFRGEHENEPAQPGWVWSDLEIDLEPTALPA